jgi:hypothetical protein
MTGQGEASRSNRLRGGLACSGYRIALNGIALNGPISFILNCPHGRVNARLGAGFKR